MTDEIFTGNKHDERVQMCLSFVSFMFYGALTPCCPNHPGEQVWVGLVTWSSLLLECTCQLNPAIRGRGTGLMLIISADWWTQIQLQGLNGRSAT